MLTIEDVSRILNVPKSTLYALAAEGIIPSVKIGKSIRIKESDLLAWLDENTRKKA